MVEVDSIVLENNQEYIKITEKIINNIKYYLLANPNSYSDFVIRKQIGEEIVGLNDEEEFNKVISVLMKQ